MTAEQKAKELIDKFKEQIEKEASEYASKHIANDKSTVSWCLEEGLKKAFESEVMQRVKADFACGFAEWLQDNRWFLFSNGKWNYTFEHGTAISEKTYEKNYRKTTTELLEIYKQQINGKQGNKI